MLPDPSRHGASPDSRELDGRRRPVLTIAAGLRDLTIARELLQAGADVNAVDEEGTTALHKAIQTSGLSRGAAFVPVQGPA